MTDKMDELLCRMGDEANDRVDYSAMLTSLLAANKKQAAKRRVTVRMLGAAAAFVVLAGVGSIALSSGFGAKNAQTPMLTMATDSAYEEAAAAACEEAIVEEPASASEGEMGVFEMEAAQETPAEDAMSSGAGDAGGKERDGEMLLSSFGADDLFDIGLPRQGWQETLLLELPDAAISEENVESGLDAGFAYISNAGNYAIWNTGSGTFSIAGETGAQETLLERLKELCK